MNPLEVTLKKYGDVDALTLRGSLVLGGAVDSLKEMMRNLAEHGTSSFVLCMSEVTRLDSSGIGLLVSMLQESKRNGGSVKLVKPSNPVISTLRMCAVLPLFEVFQEEEEAIASFG